MIKPTVGRVVHFIPHRTDKLAFSDQPLAALVTYVHSDTMVNLAVFDSNGNSHGRTSINLEQDTPLDGLTGSFCRWMPYQTGQAAKTERLQAQLDAKS
ncbi:hypothetical protein [Bradyrhizobium cenepequi]